MYRILSCLTVAAWVGAIAVAACSIARLGPGGRRPHHRACGGGVQVGQLHCRAAPRFAGPGRAGSGTVAGVGEGAA